MIVRFLEIFSAHPFPERINTHRSAQDKGSAERDFIMKGGGGMSLTESEYDALTKRYSQNSKPWINVPKAFLIGGGSVPWDKASSKAIPGWVSRGLASGACSMTLVVLSALCTGLGIYDQIARHAGAGTLVPITGFANAMVSPALEFKSEGLILGTGAKMFAIAGRCWSMASVLRCCMD